VVRCGGRTTGPASEEVDAMGDAELAARILVRLNELPPSKVRENLLGFAVTQLGVIDAGQVRRVAQHLKEIGWLTKLTVTLEGDLFALLSSRGSMAIDSAGSIAELERRLLDGDAPQIDQSVNIAGSVHGSNLSAHSRNVSQRIESVDGVEAVLGRM